MGARVVFSNSLTFSVDLSEVGSSLSLRDAGFAVALAVDSVVGVSSSGSLDVVLCRCRISVMYLEFRENI